MLTIQLVREPAYMTADGQFIHVFVKFAELEEEVAFVATPTDPEAHGRFLYQQAIDGVYGTVRPYTPPPEGIINDSQSNPA